MSSIGSSGSSPAGDSSRPLPPDAQLPELPLQKRPRAARLIEQLVENGISETALAEAIVVPVALLAEFRSGRVQLPLDRQLCLALYAIERVPRARRAGFTLRAQVEAEIALASDSTETHAAPPVTHRWP